MKHFRLDNTDGFSEEELEELNLEAEQRITDKMNEDQVQNELEAIFNEYCDKIAGDI